MWTWFGKTGVGAEVGNWGPAGWQKKLGGDGIGEAGQRRLYGGRRLLAFSKASASNTCNDS